MSVLGVQILRKVSFSPEAQAVIDRMTGLTNDEKNAIATFVDAEVLNGNWALIDEFWCFKLITEANSLISWKTKIATNNGAVHGGSGFTFNGTNQYINSNYNLVNDSINLSQNN